MSKKAVILMNLGSPDSTKVSDVRKYLKEFLMDERVIDLPYLGRLLLVKGIIAPFRAPKSAEAYRSIWTKEGSPLITITKELQKAVQAKVDFPIEIAMRYGNPSPKYAYDKIVRENPDIEEVILFPLYPHYAMSSYETAVEYMKEVYRQNDYKFSLRNVDPYFSNTQYIHALSESIKPYLIEPFDKLLFSFHGVPERHIFKDHQKFAPQLPENHICLGQCANVQCYRSHVRKTTSLVMSELGLETTQWEQSFQSRLGRDPWLQPYTAQRLAELPKEGVKRLVVASPAFVSDCLETLEEIAIQGKETFLSAGGESFTVVPCLNTNELWVDTIIELISSAKAIEA